MNWPILQQKIRSNVPLVIIVMAIMTFIPFYYYTFYNPHAMYSNIDENLLSVANNLFNGTGLYDGTVIPNQPIANTHMGLAFLEILLLKAGVQDISALYALIGTIHYVSFLFCVFLLYQLSRYLQLTATLTILIVKWSGLSRPFFCFFKV